MLAVYIVDKGKKLKKCQSFHGADKKKESRLLFQTFWSKRADLNQVQMSHWMKESK
jgi:hypothetical protein